MLIKTNQPIGFNRKETTAQVAQFWDQTSEGWQKIWGMHIHHGYYENEHNISPQGAQEKLIIKLVELLDIPQGAEILDVGCGMGGSSFYFAEKFHAKVTGITLSQKQVQMAEHRTKQLNIENVTFKVEDALSLSSMPDNSVDIVWSLESCEQFYDKTLFLKQAFRVLKPGGKLMLATWCSDREEYEDVQANKYQKLCLEFDLPYMPTIEYYRSILSKENFSLKTSLDWSEYVKKSWDIGLSLVNTYSFLKLLKLGGFRGLRFAKQIKLMHHAFQQNMIRYGIFIAIKK